MSANALVLTPQSNILASGGNDRRILLWDTFSLDNKPCKSIRTKQDGDILQCRLIVKESAYSAGVHSAAYLFHDLQTGDAGSFDGSLVS